MEEGVFRLDGRHGLNRMSAMDGSGTGFRQTKMQDFAFCDQILDGAGYLFNRYVGIDTMLVIEIDTIRLQPLE
ncbi:hypothetical protein D3C87_1822880 [compost metagenome]